MTEGIETKSIDNEETKYMTADATETSIWLIKLFRTMIEKRWGMTIDDRDDDGGEEQDKAAADIMKVLNDVGATVLCIDIISPGIDRTLQIEALKLCVALLFLEGGALEVQTTIYNHLNR